MNWSEQQSRIFDAFAKGKGNVVIRARAGTGKTTTILEGIKYASDKKILLAAFNKHIAKEMESRLTNPCAHVKTLHSLGYGIVRRFIPNVKIDEDRCKKIIIKLLGKNVPRSVISTLEKLTSKCKNVCPSPELSQIISTAYAFDLDPDDSMINDGWTVEKLANNVISILNESIKMDDGTIDFDDMVFVPVRKNWIRPAYDLVVIDEAQDMNLIQLIMAKKVCKKRIIVVGDDRQAIYGFRGADSNCIDRLKTELEAEELGLTITYRCPKKIVQCINNIVPDYKAANHAINGEIIEINYNKFINIVSPGAFVLSRVNAPLAKVCLQMLRNNIRSIIKGRSVGLQLASMVKKIGEHNIDIMLKKLSVWEKNQIDHLSSIDSKDARNKIDVVRDQAETIRALSDGCDDVSQIINRLEVLFTEDTNKPNYVICSSVHKIKGLEADVVFLLKDTFRSSKDGKGEEDNIRYVAITRTKKKLIWVSDIK